MQKEQSCTGKEPPARNGSESSTPRRQRRRKEVSWRMRGGEALRWVGFDTETFRGRAKLLASSSGRFLENGTTESFLKFLWDEMPNLHDAGVFYNLRFDASALLRDAAKSTPDAVRSGDFVVGPYHVHHVPGKALVLGHGIQARRIYDAAQFYPGGLDRCAQMVLGEGKNASELGIDRERIGNEPGYYEAHREPIIKYCIQDAKLAGRLMQRFQQDVATSVGVYPASWYSGASVAKSLLMGLGWKNPAYDWPTELINDSVAAFSGGIFDTRVLGCMEGVSEIDINSAYPTAISKLPELGKPYEVREPTRDKALGLYLVELTYDGTVPYRMPDRKTIIYPISSEPIKAWLYDCELNFFDIARFVRGWEVERKEGAGYPFRETMNRLYSLRREMKVKGDPRELAVKTAMNSMFGAFAETKNGWTRFTNLVYAGWITAWTRNYLRYLMETTHGEIVSMATDSLAFTGETDAPESDEMGGLKFAFRNATVVTYANGIRVINGKLAKVRGLPRKIVLGKDGKRVEKWLEADDFFRARGSILNLVGSGPLPLLSGIVQGRQDEIASWVDAPKQVRLESNMVRGVPDGPLTFEYLADNPVRLSRPIVSSDPTFKCLTPAQVEALENNRYPGPFRVQDLETEEEEEA